MSDKTLTQDMSQEQKVEEMIINPKAGLVSRVKTAFKLLLLTKSIFVRFRGSITQITFIFPRIAQKFIQKNRIEILCETGTHFKFWWKKHYRDVQVCYSGFGIAFIYHSKWRLDNLQAIQELHMEVQQAEANWRSNPAIRTAQLRKQIDTKTEQRNKLVKELES